MEPLNAPIALVVAGLPAKEARRAANVVHTGVQAEAEGSGSRHTRADAVEPRAEPMSQHVVDRGHPQPHRGETPGVTAVLAEQLLQTIGNIKRLPKLTEGPFSDPSPKARRDPLKTATLNTQRTITTLTGLNIVGYVRVVERSTRPGRLRPRCDRQRP